MSLLPDLPGGQLGYQELVGARVVWLLEVRFASRVFRFASANDVILDQDNLLTTDEIGYLGQLEVSINRELQLFNVAPEPLSVPFELVFPVDVAELIAQGADLSAATAELSILVGDRAYEDRIIILRGKLVEPQYGAEGEPVSFSVEENLYQDAGVFPPTTWAVTAETWPTLYAGGTLLGNPWPTETIGRVYPFVFGSPYGSENYDGTYATHSRTPAYLVDAVDVGGGGITIGSYLIIAGHPVGADAVEIYKYSPEANAGVFNFNTEQIEDSLGQLITVVTSTDSDFFTDLGQQLWVRWIDALDEHQDAAQTDQGNVLDGAGDLMVHLLRYSTLPVDTGRFRAASPTLNAFKVHGYIDQHVTPYEWLQDNLLPLLPVSIASGPNGVYPVVWDVRATRERAVCHLEARRMIPSAGDYGRPDMQRLSPVTYEGDPDRVINEITIEFGFVPASGVYRQRLTLTSEFLTEAEAPNQLARHHITSVYSRASQAKYGVKPFTLQSEIIQDYATAAQILHWMVLSQGFVYRVVEYALDVRFAWLQLGDTVTLTDNELHLDECVAMVRGIRWAGDQLSVVFVLLEDPARDLHATG